MNNGVDYTIYLQPIYLEVTCPHCKAKLTLFDGDGVDLLMLNLILSTVRCVGGDWGNGRYEKM